MEEGVQRWAVNSTAWSPAEEEFTFCLHLLPPTLHHEVLMYRFMADRKRALISRLLQRRAVHLALDVSYDEIDIQRTREGKPFLTNAPPHPPFPNFNFNVSHHGDFVALASEPVSLVGVDVMAHDARRNEPLPQFFQSFQEHLTANEWRAVHGAGPDRGPVLDQFYRHWSLKEAYIKAVGIGFGFELQRIEFRYKGGDPWASEALATIDGADRSDWRFFLARLGVDHWTCVARGPPQDATSSYRSASASGELTPQQLSLGLGLENKSFEILSIIDLIPKARLVEYMSVKATG